MKKEKGLVLINTGDGKGKTTAALGIVVRSLGNKKKVCIIQFIKSPDSKTGELKFFQELGVEIYPMGVGFTIDNTPEDNREALKKSCDLFVEKINDASYDLIVLDEINYALDIKDFDISDILNVNFVIDTLNKRSEKTNVILTGRNAKPEIIEYADLVTEMKCIKHYYDSGITATRGIEF